jgi:hypothetical protein
VDLSLLQPVGVPSIKKLGFHRTFVDNNCNKFAVYLKIVSLPVKRLVFRGPFDCFSLFDVRSLEVAIRGFSDFDHHYCQPTLCKNTGRCL